MEYEKRNDRNDEVFSKSVKAGKRTYFFDIKTTKGNELYLTLTESKKVFEDGREYFQKHKIFLYKEDFNKFIKGLAEAIDYVKTDLMPDFDFDAFNHENPYEGEEGTYQGTTSNSGDNDSSAAISPEKEIIAPSAAVESENQVPLDNGSTEEVDKW